MGQKVTIGGERLGSGNKMQTELRNYGRSTHNLTNTFRSTMACGVLYPCFCKVAMRGDAFTIDLEADARTIPTKAPLFGSYKMQVDFFQCPWRLYQAILHNNPTAIGLKMNQVKLPMIKVETAWDNTLKGEQRTMQGKFADSCLQKYLGMSGIGVSSSNKATFLREYLAIPTLAYYDIFKNYYANKQEEYAYVITNKTYGSDIPWTNEDADPEITNDGSTFEGTISNNGKTITWSNLNISINARAIITADVDGNVENLQDMFRLSAINNGTTIAQLTLIEMQTFGNLFIVTANYIEDRNITRLEISYDTARFANYIAPNYNTMTLTLTDTAQTTSPLKLVPFELKNIDDMRMDILSHNNMGAPFVIERTTAYQPYLSNVNWTSDKKTSNKYEHNGLVLKTYQSDLFNNWIKTDWIDGNNGIAEITKVAVSNGGFKIDALNLAEKLYNMLNRVAVSGNTYEDWQDAVYTQSPRRHIESPVYLGGMSCEIIFEEIVQMANVSEEPEGALGTLGGKGKLLKRKGGHINVKVDEASMIIGIVSLTPRITYTQGNEWYMTELKSMDDLHKPALDGIGYEDLIGERMAWWDTHITENGTITHRSKIGKVPAWINYMTDFDRSFGEFADINKKGFMVLNRNYEIGENSTIKDATTYIDPTKYNYAFAYTELDAQNFWVEVYSHVKARRLMSAKQIPNV